MGTLDLYEDSVFDNTVEGLEENAELELEIVEEFESSANFSKTKTT